MYMLVLNAILSCMGMSEFRDKANLYCMSFNIIMKTVESMEISLNIYTFQ